MPLKQQIENIPEKVKSEIKDRLREFSSFSRKDSKEWFSELCFCILTANAKAKTALALQNTLGFEGFIRHDEKKLAEIIKSHKHRFHNNKAKYIVLARQFTDIKEKLNQFKDNNEKRKFLVNNVKGLGYKEASHFLRNTGHFNLAILDRHILNLLHENNIIYNVPRPLNPKTYLEIEDKFNKIAFLLNQNPASLDLHMWYLKTGNVL